MPQGGPAISVRGVFSHQNRVCCYIRVVLWVRAISSWGAFSCARSALRTRGRILRKKLGFLTHDAWRQKPLGRKYLFRGWGESLAPKNGVFPPPRSTFVAGRSFLRQNTAFSGARCLVAKKRGKEIFVSWVGELLVRKNNVFWRTSNACCAGKLLASKNCVFWRTMACGKNALGGNFRFMVAGDFLRQKTTFSGARSTCATQGGVLRQKIAFSSAQCLVPKALGGNICCIAGGNLMRQKTAFFSAGRTLAARRCSQRKQNCFFWRTMPCCKIALE